MNTTTTMTTQMDVETNEAKNLKKYLSTGNGVSVTNTSCQPVEDLIKGFHAGDQVSMEESDMSQEWRSFQDDDMDKSRVGRAEISLLENDLSTTIAGSESNYSKRLVLMSAYKSVVDMCSRIHLERVIANDAFHQFKVVKECDPCRGRDKEVLLWCCIYNSCQAAGRSRPLKEIVAVSGKPKKALLKGLRFISRRLMSNKCEDININVPLPEPQQQKQSKHHNAPKFYLQKQLEITHNSLTEFMPRSCNLLGLSFEVQKVAARIAERAVEKSLGRGLSPTTLASAILFIASELCHCKKSLNDICGVTGTSFSDIKDCLKNMAPHLKSICADQKIEKNITIKLTRSERNRRE